MNVATEKYKVASLIHAIMMLIWPQRSVTAMVIPSSAAPCYPFPDAFAVRTFCAQRHDNHLRRHYAIHRIMKFSTVQFVTWWSFFLLLWLCTMLRACTTNNERIHRDRPTNNVDQTSCINNWTVSAVRLNIFLHRSLRGRVFLMFLYFSVFCLLHGRGSIFVFFFFCLLLSVLSEFHYGFGLSKNAHACSRSLQFSRICFIWALCVHSPFDRCTVQIKKVNARSIWILCLFIRFCVNVAIWLHKLKKKKTINILCDIENARAAWTIRQKRIFLFIYENCLIGCWVSWISLYFFLCIFVVVVVVIRHNDDSIASIYSQQRSHWSAKWACSCGGWSLWLVSQKMPRTDVQMCTSIVSGVCVCVSYFCDQFAFECRCNVLALATECHHSGFVNVLRLPCTMRILWNYIHTF